MKLNLKNIIELISFKKQREYKKICQNNSINIENKSPKITLDIKGRNNQIYIDKSVNKDAKIIIGIYGDNNKVIINKEVNISQFLKIVLGQEHKNFGKCNNTSFSIGENSSIESMTYITFNSNSQCEIGKDCMISYNVTFYNTDAHPIFDNQTGKIINKVKGIKIGNHCWLGANSTVLKNSVMKDNSILGYNAVLTSSSAKDIIKTCGGGDLCRKPCPTC